jgi:hypothetical protein
MVNFQPEKEKKKKLFVMYVNYNTGFVIVLLQTVSLNMITLELLVL